MSVAVEYPQVDQVCRGGDASKGHGESGTRGSRSAAESEARDVSTVAVLILGPRAPIEGLLVNDPPLEIGMFVVDATVDHRYTDAGAVKTVALSDVGVDFGGFHRAFHRATEQFSIPRFIHGRRVGHLEINTSNAF